MVNKSFQKPLVCSQCHIHAVHTRRLSQAKTMRQSHQQSTQKPVIPDPGVSFIQQQQSTSVVLKRAFCCTWLCSLNIHFACIGVAKYVSERECVTQYTSWIWIFSHFYVMCICNKLSLVLAHMCTYTVWEWMGCKTMRIVSVLFCIMCRINSSHTPRSYHLCVHFVYLCWLADGHWWPPFWVLRPVWGGGGGGGSMLDQSAVPHCWPIPTYYPTQG